MCESRRISFFFLLYFTRPIDFNSSYSEIFTLDKVNFFDICIFYHVSYILAKFSKLQKEFCTCCLKLPSMAKKFKATDNFWSRTWLEKIYIPTKGVHLHTLYQNFINIRLTKTYLNLCRNLSKISYVSWTDTYLLGVK